MKTKFRLGFAAAAMAILCGCASITPQQIASANQLATAVIDLSNLTPQQKQAALYGVAAVSQAYVGYNAPQAVLAQSAGYPDAGKEIANALPAKTMTQGQVSELYKAAALIK